eukprot:403361426
MTKDGVVIVAHDDDLKRLCGIDRKIEEFNYEELPLIKRSITTHFSEGEYQLLDHENGKFTTLREMFEISQYKMISIDLKNASEEISDKVNELIKEFKRENLTIWGSMFPSQHKKIGKLNPNIPQFFSGGQTLTVYLLYYLGLLFLYPLPSDAFMVPLFTQEKLKLFSGAFKKRGRGGLLGHMIIILMGVLIGNSKNLYRHLRKRGVIVVVWVLNEESEFQEALDYAPEIDGVMTDSPQKLREFVEKYNLTYIPKYE